MDIIRTLLPIRTRTRRSKKHGPNVGTEITIKGIIARPAPQITTIIEGLMLTWNIIQTSGVLAMIATLLMIHNTAAVVLPVVPPVATST